MGLAAACGIFPDLGLNPSLLLWQEDSLPLSYREVLFLLLDHNFICVLKSLYVRVAASDYVELSIYLDLGWVVM